MEDEKLIAWIALGISILSFGTSIWSAFIGHRSYNHTKSVHETELELAFEKERSELLEIINTSRSILDKTRIEIGTLKAEFDSEHAKVQALLANYTNLFTEFLPRIEAGVTQATMLWNEVAEWNFKTGIKAMVSHQSRYRALIHEDQTVHESALYCIKVFRDKLDRAKLAVSMSKSITF
ncbi:MAG: hypothetical protein CTY10_08255 [Methylotenera sp.]|nr:MAG: hypothetical protein CTY10_08255 [Methylotenera sp.]